MQMRLLGSFHKNTGTRSTLPARPKQRQGSATLHAAAARIHAPPPALLDAIRTANDAWLDACIEQPLLDDHTNSAVHLFGVTAYAPLQYEGLAEAFKRLQPTHMAIEQPPGACAPGVVLPQPQWIAAVLDSFDAVVCRSTLDPSAGPPAAPGGPAAVATLREALVAATLEARVGKDLIDYYEGFGFYPGLDFVLRPHHVTDTLQLFGYLAGGEYVAAAQKAADAGVQLACIDSPLKLQEGWVRGMVEAFDLQEAQLHSLRLNALLAENAELLHPAAAAWDMELGAAFSAAATAEGASGTGRDASNNASTSGREGDDGADAAAVAAQQEGSLLAFKVSRAGAAAALGPEQADEALRRQQVLQPLKYQHFRLRTKHMARQLRELCDRANYSASNSDEATSSNGTGVGKQGSWTSAAVGDAGGKFSTTGNPQDQGQGHGMQLGQLQQRTVVLAVVGRQHVPGLRQLWHDKTSALWRDRMPREFSPSRVGAGSTAGKTV